MIQPKRTKKPSNENGLPLVLGLILLAVLAMIPLTGCEPVPIALQSDLAPQTTTMPSLKGPDLEAVEAQRRSDFRMEMHTYQVEMSLLANDFVRWTEESIRADALLMSAARRNDKPLVTHYVKARQALAEVGEKLDQKMFALRQRLSDLRFDAVQYDRDNPNMILLKQKGAK